MLLFKAVAEDDGVVDGQRQLQNARDGIRHEGDLAKQVVRALIDDHANAERQDQNRNLAVGLGCKQQHRDNDDRDIDHDHVDLALDRLGLRIAKVCLDVDVLSAQVLLDLVKRVETGIVRLVVIERDAVERGGAVSYTHLDVYKRQGSRGSSWPEAG